MIYFNHIGDFSKATKYLEDIKKVAKLELLNKYGQAGVAALSSATPVETGKTASSWSYVIVEKDGADVIEFHNCNIVSGVPIAIILQYGHGTGTGGKVRRKRKKQIHLDSRNSEKSSGSWSRKSVRGNPGIFTDLADDVCGADTKSIRFFCWKCGPHF